MRDRVRTFGRQLLDRVAAHRLKDLAAQLAFWALLALFPFCIFLLTIVGYVPLAGLEDELLGLLHVVMPVDAWSLFDRTVHEVLHRRHGVLLVVSLVAALWSASSGLASLRYALNLAWGVPDDRAWWRVRVRSAVMIVCAAALIIVALTGLLLGPNVLRYVYDWFDLGKLSLRVWAVVRWPIVILDLLIMLGLVYHFVPNVRRRFRLFSPGSATALLCWLAGSSLFRVYVAHFDAYARSYGTLGAAIVLLLWLYLSAATLILGCEVDALLASGEDSAGK